MTIDNKIFLLREIMGEAALVHMTGLDRRDVQRIARGEATLYPETGRRLRQNIQEAAGVIGLKTPIAASQIAEQVRRISTRGRSSDIRVALYLWATGRTIALADLCEDLAGDRDDSAITGAAHNLARAGLVVVEEGGTHHNSKQVRWVGAEK